MMLIRSDAKRYGAAYPWGNELRFLALLCVSTLSYPCVVRTNTTVLIDKASVQSVRRHGANSTVSLQEYHL
jgi:hypothetical protein